MKGKRPGIQSATAVITAAAIAIRTYGGWDFNALETFGGEERRVRFLHFTQ